MQESSARASGAVHDRFRKKLDVLAIVCFVVWHVVDESTPTSTDTDDAMSIAQRANGYRSYRGIQTGDVPTAGKNAYRFFRQLDLLSGCAWMTRVGLEPTTYGLKVRCSTN